MNTKTEGLSENELSEGQSLVRDGFEAWARDRALDLSETLGPWGDRMYLHPHIHSLWSGWRAALICSRTPIESNTEPVAFKTFTYTRTFNAIAAAVEWKPNHAFGISVAKFIEAFGTVDAPVSVAPAVTDEQKVTVQPLRWAELRSEEC